MPLDLGLTKLADLAKWQGLSPISNDVLTAHMAAEVTKRPGSWAYRHNILANVLAILSLVGSTLGCGVALTCIIVSLFTATNLFLAIACIPIALVCGLSASWLLNKGVMEPFKWKVYGPAQWAESRSNFKSLQYHNIPASIITLARKMDGMRDDGFFVVGELFQDHKVVDPYLVYRTHDGDQIVLAIWDDNGIIHQA